jgi:uncharacterized protein YoxC
MSDSIIKADFFFVVTTVAVIIVSVFLVIGLVYVIQILRNLKSLSNKAKVEGEKILDDVKFIRENAENSGAGMLTKIFRFINKYRKKK